MANPLARVVMNNIAQKSGKVDKKSYGVSSVGRSSNFGKREAQLLSSLINNKASVSSGSASYNKSTYGRSSNVSNASNANKVNTMKTLDSLVSGKPAKVETSKTSVNSCGIGKARPNLKSLCSLDNITVGKSSANTTVATRDNNRNVMQKLDLNDLAKGVNKSEKKEVKSSYKQTGGITSLGDLANSKTKNSQKQEISNNDKVITTNNSYVKSNVISNLEAYVPRVTLESIGKKGSLF